MKEYVMKCAEGKHVAIVQGITDNQVGVPPLLQGF
jgi:hypothetical protein